MKKIWKKQMQGSALRMAAAMWAAGICLFFALMGSGSYPVFAAVPRVMVSDYQIEEGIVMAGSPFNLTIVLKNTAARTSVRNLKVTVTSENGEFLPTEGAGTAYLEKIDADSETAITFPLYAIDSLEEKSYKLTIKTEYEDPSGNPYDVTDTIYLPITLKQRILISDLYLADYEVQLGDTVEISAMANNLGTGTLYNVKAHIEGDNVMEQDSYIGNIAAGKSGTLDVLTKADAVSREVGDKNTLVITYEDKAGEVNTETMEFSLTVSQPVYENLEKVKDSPDVSLILKRILIAAVIIACMVLIIVLARRHYLRKKRMLDEI